MMKRKLAKRRLKFSIRSLFACIAIIALLLALGIRFGGQTVWLATSGQRPTIQAIPASLLVSEPVEEETDSLNIGPVVLELPASMCQTFAVQRPGNGSINLHFTDNTRTAVVNLTPIRDFAMFPLTDFPDKVGITDLRLYREIANTGSSDFSLGMTAEQLRWHKWLVANREIIADVESIEYVETPDFEANLLRLSSTIYSFEWGTTNGKWKGAVTFVDPTGDARWIRFAASTFELRGDPSVFLMAADAELRALVASSRDATAPE